MREPTAVGFYPPEKSKIESAVKKLLSSVKVKKRDVLGAVVPHAGYAFSGKTAAHVYTSLKKGFDTVVIIGPDHAGMSKKVSVGTESWELLTGVVEPDKALAEKILGGSELFDHDDFAHTYEHSIEVQLPFLQKVLGKFKLVPIMIPSFLSTAGACDEIGSAIAKACKGKKVLILASSDFTHFGSGYGFKPASRNVVKWVTDTDNAIIDAIKEMDNEKILKLALETTMCGHGPVMALVSAMKGRAKKAELLDYSTSFDASGDKSVIVGYGGIIFE